MHKRIVLLIIFISMTAAAAFAKPAIDFEGSIANIGENELIIDIGRAKQSGIISYDIIFINKGSSVLTIKSLEACCGRSAELLTNKDTAPGKKGKIRFSFNTRNRSGVITERCIINTNEPGREQITVYIKVEVLP